MPGTELPFDIRNYVRDSERDNDYIQAGYDAINRMEALIGDIPFRDLFGLQLGVIATRMAAKVPHAAKRCLIKRPDAVQDLLCCLNPIKLSLQQLIESGYDEANQRIYEIMLDLWRHGIYLPRPAGCEARDVKLLKSLRGLLEHAGSFTYRQLFDTPAINLSRTTLNAIQRSKRNGVIFMAANAKCCRCIASDGGTSCSCIVGNPTDFCAIVSGSNPPACTANSTDCITT